MKNVKHNTTPNRIRLYLKVVLIMLLSACFSPAVAQNTKGDSPSGNRDSRFRIQSKKKNKNKKSSVSNKRIKAKTSPANRVISAERPRSRGKSERAGKPIRPVYSVKKPSNKQKVWKGDLTGRKIRTKGTESSARQVYPQEGRYMRKTVPEREGRRNVSPRTVRVQSSTGRTRNVYSQSDRRYSRTPSPRPRNTQNPVSNREQLSRLKRLQGNQRSSSSAKKVTVVPRSASRSYIRHKSINWYANLPRPKRKGERATTKDIAGRPLRARNYETPRPGIIPSTSPYQNRRRISGDRSYRGPSGGYRSATRKGERAWMGDIASRNIRHRNRTSKKSVEGVPTLPVPYLSISKHGEKRPGRMNWSVRSISGRRWNNSGSPLPVRQGKTNVSGIPVRSRTKTFDEQGEGFSGNLRFRRPFKGGGSASGRSWNNKGVPIQGRGPRDADRAVGYTGNIKAGRPVKGGGSVSGRLWNNNESAIQGKQPRQGERAALYQGNIKTGRPIKGGGSVSGKLWNNNETAIQGRQPKQGERAALYQGNIKTGRPQKGGGSVSGKLWNNNETAIQGRQPKQGERAALYQGNIKTGRPQKGGGSVSGKLWNNNQTPILVRTPNEKARAAGEYTGNIKHNPMEPKFKDQGEEFTGYTKLGKFRKSYIQHKKAADASVLKRRPTKEAYLADNLSPKIKRRSYVENKSAADDALLKLKPTKVTTEIDQLQVRVKRRSYISNKNSADDALLKLSPTKTTRDVNELHVKVKQYNYIHNKSSAREALKVREPGKAFAKASDYQGNIKMQKFRLIEKNRALHPDARFVKTNKNNVKEERDTMTNFKLWWARLFKKQETQPEHLKDKGRKPRYDKGEQGLWYD